MKAIASIADMRETFARLSPQIDLTIAGRDRINDRAFALVKIQNAIAQLIQGKITPDEYIQTIEPLIGLWGTVDEYIAEVSVTLGIGDGMA